MTGSRTTRSLSLEASITAPRCAFRPLPIRSDGPSSCFVVLWFCWCSPLAVLVVHPLLWFCWCAPPAVLLMQLSSGSVGASHSLVLLVQPLLPFCWCRPSRVLLGPSSSSVGASPPMVLLLQPLLQFYWCNPYFGSFGAAPSLVLLVQPLLWFCWCSLNSSCHICITLNRYS